MSTVYFEQDDAPNVAIDLREPFIAALLAFLWPGAGHFYQRRFAKGFIFMICILGIFFVGLGLGRGRCVYASWKQNDKRWQYFFQVGVGIPAMPALLQYSKTRGDSDPMFVIAERYPEGEALFGAKQFEVIEDMDEFRRVYGNDVKTIKDGFMAPPHGKIDQNNIDTLGAWHRDMGHLFEIGTLYCIVAGLLNWLAVYDAFAGPAIVRNRKRTVPEEEEPEPARAEDESDSESPPEKDPDEPGARNKPKRKKRKTPSRK